MSSNSNKKPKTEEDFAAVRAYLEQSPFGKDHPAIKAALAGIDMEQQRIHRDSKLQAKFAQANSRSNTSGNMRLVDSVESEDTDAVEVERPVDHDLVNGKDSIDTSILTKEHDDSMEEDWQNVDNTEANEDVGSLLAKQAVTGLSENNVLCSTPTAALAAVLHAVLLASGFACTGIPETAANTGGFAAPVRNLKAYVPADWDKSPTIQLRYRKPEMGAIVLSVSPSTPDHGQIEVSLDPANRSSNYEPNVFHLNVADHINLESFHRAAGKQSKVPPALHFKALATLLTRFGAHFDLGNLNHAHSLPYVDYTMLQQRQSFLTSSKIDSQSSSAVPSTMFTGRTSVSNNPIGGNGPSGDFFGDLMPTGIHQFPGSRSGVPGFGPGNLMGPNHPMFGRAGSTGLTFGSGGPMGGAGGILPMNTGVGTLRPRFDPFGPPGGPTEQHPVGPVDPDGNILQNDPLIYQRQGPPGGTGVPNNDIGKPTSMPNNDMFL